MDADQAVKIVIETVSDVLEGKAEVTESTQIWGRESSIDSMKIVEICIALEDASYDCGFEFDWTSEMAMSKSRGMFNSVRSLAEEFAHQSEAKS